MTYPAGMLVNKLTGRYHPIIFRLAPLPDAKDHEPGEPAQRYRSIGHHTEGFDAEEDAMAFIEGNPQYRWAQVVWEWSGIEMPAITTWFGREYL